MSAHADERKMLLESLPPPDDAAGWAEYVGRVLGRTEGCPATVELLRLGRGLATADAAKQLEAHLEGCAYCRSWVKGFRRAGKDVAFEQHFRDLLAKGARASEAAGAPVEEEETPPLWAPNGHELVTGVLTNWKRGERRLALELLGPHLGALLAAHGLSPNLTGQLEAFLREQADKPSPPRTHLLLSWLEEFARGQGFEELPYRPSADELAAALESSVVRVMIEEQKDARAEPVKDFYERVAAKPIRQSEELLHLGEGPIERQWARDLYNRAKRVTRTARAILVA